LESVHKAIWDMPERTESHLLVQHVRPDDYEALARRGFFAFDWADVHRTVGRSGLYEIQARPAEPASFDDALWPASGRPTFDAFFAVNYSYADGPYTVGPHFVFTGSTGADRSMTPAELFALDAALPPVARASDSIALARLRAWVRANPTARTRYPANQILEGWLLDGRQ
jgi:hypothetical protein